MDECWVCTPWGRSVAATVRSQRPASEELPVASPPPPPLGTSDIFVTDGFRERFSLQYFLGYLFVCLITSIFWAKSVPKTIAMVSEKSNPCNLSSPSMP